MKRPMTNSELIHHAMNYSKHGALMQVVVMEGLRNYCQYVVDCPPGFLGEASNMFSEDAWKGTCQEWLDLYAKRDQMMIEDIAVEVDDFTQEAATFDDDPEKLGLLKMLQHLELNGWVVTHVDDGEELIKADNKALAEVVDDAAAVELANIRFSKAEGLGTGTIMLVWGNSPIELIADHTTNHGFDEAVDAAQRSVWPNYPED